MKTPSVSLKPVLNFMASVRREPSRTLLAAQAVALVLYPLASESRSGHLFATLISVGVLAMAIRMVDRSPREAWLAALFAILGVVLWQLHLSNASQAVGVAGALLYATAYFYSAWALIAYMMADEQTTIDELWAAAATFMLFVEAYAWLFMALQLAQPGAFSLPGSAPGSQRTWVELVFLAGTNFSATGLGDILPATPVARVLLIIEQWNGVMFLAIVVARLAGMLKARA